MIGWVSYVTNVVSFLDEPFWPEPDLLELIRKIEINIPPKDTLRFDSRVERFNWEAVRTIHYDKNYYKKLFNWNDNVFLLFVVGCFWRLWYATVQAHVDPYTEASAPLPSFERNSGGRQGLGFSAVDQLLPQPQAEQAPRPAAPPTLHLHDLLPREEGQGRQREPWPRDGTLTSVVAYPVHVLTSVSLFQTEISKRIAFMYKNLSDKQKQKFVQKAAQQRQEYEVKLEAF